MKDLSNENIIHIEKDGIEYLQFRKLLEYSDVINHAYGIGLDKNYRKVVTNHANSLLEKGDSNDINDINDYKILANSIGINYINIVQANQTHTKNIKKIDRKVMQDKPDFNLDEYNSVDGLVTNKKNIALATINADCILMLFFDPVRKVIANVHSGWKGTLQRISVEAVDKMKQEYGCNPQDIICCICPSIRRCHFKVHSDVQEPYYNEFKELEEINRLIVPIPGEDRWTIDTVEINKIILKQAGLKAKNIIDSGICSVCNSDKIHSFRVEKEGYGVGTAIIELK